MRKRDIEPGQVYTRSELQERFGGSRYSGISVSAASNTIMLFSDRKAGWNRNFDVVDGGDSYGSLVLYIGEGTTGDQTLTRGNAALLNHAERGRTIRLFIDADSDEGKRTRAWRYLGFFDLDKVLPFHWQTAHDASGRERKVLAFRLRPSLGALLPPDDFKPPAAELVRSEIPSGPVAQGNVEAFSESSHDPTRQAAVLQREARLLDDFRSHLRAQGHEAHGSVNSVPGSSAVVMIDLYDSTTGTLYKVKGDSGRSSVRQAIGEVLDLGRIQSPESTLAILVPERPHDDLVALVSGLNIGIAYADGSGDFKTVIPQVVASWGGQR